MHETELVEPSVSAIALRFKKNGGLVRFLHMPANLFFICVCLAAEGPRGEPHYLLILRAVMQRLTSLH